MALDATLEAATLGRTSHIDEFACRKRICFEDLTDLELGDLVSFDLAKRSRHIAARFAMTLFGLRQSLIESESELNGFIAIRIGGFDLRYDIRTEFNHGNRMHDARVVEDLRHTELTPDKALNHWLSPDYQDTSPATMAADAFRA
jgi:hypothetical protein